jgi:hypothetical protein
VKNFDEEVWKRGVWHSLFCLERSTSFNLAISHRSCVFAHFHYQTDNTAESFRLVREANYLKFTREVSKSDICDRLLATGERELVDASPFDRVWGIGFKAADAKKMDDNREQWGENQFGKTLMEVRRTIEFQRDPDATAVFDTPGSGFYINW